MSRPSLDTLPLELLYRIIDNIDVRTIFLSFRNVCKRFNAIVDSYNLYKLDFRLITKPDFDKVCRVIRPENVISMTLSDEDETPGLIGLFISLVDIRQFTRLQSLALIQIDDTNLDRFVKNMVTTSLVSLSIDSTEFDHRTLALFSSATEKVDQIFMPTLEMNRSTKEHKCTSLKCFIKELSVTDCTFESYFDILRNLIHLEKFVLNNNCLINVVQTVPPSDLTSDLKSLIIEQDNMTIDMCQSMVSMTSSLRYFKIKVTYAGRSFYDGSKWELFIQTKLCNLKTFEFYFEIYLNENLSIDDLNSIMDSYRTPFWIQVKQWFVTCDYSKTMHLLTIYSTPSVQSPFRHIPESEKNSESISITTNPDKQAMKNHISSLQVSLPSSKARNTSKKVFYIMVS
ncbi:unnamed protein product [Rotaria sordida]|uniref:F-box domain-containing protein n=1 Tax=Rotaria sordida TaxID=392033 RepID=A0A814ZM43_9BILA|nr:unnamed protein product [Rotaria sordida]CAF1528921.1 unnamed protein product [Rotaria sordida]